MFHIQLGTPKFTQMLFVSSNNWLKLVWADNKLPISSTPVEMFDNQLGTPKFTQIG